MKKTILGCLLSFSLGSLSGVVLAQGQGGPWVPTDPGQDCTLAGEFCGNINAECTNKGGSCATGGTHGEDGWYDPDADGCGCQI